MLVIKIYKIKLLWLFNSSLHIRLLAVVVELQRGWRLELPSYHRQWSKFRKTHSD